MTRSMNLSICLIIAALVHIYHILEGYDRYECYDNG